MTKISGALNRKFHRGITIGVAGLDVEEIDILVSNLPAFERAQIALVEKYSAKPPTVPPLFTNAITTTLDDGTTVTVLTLIRNWTFQEALTSALVVSADTSTDTIAKLLTECGHLASDAQIEEMKRRTDAGENTGMRTDGWGNFFPQADKTGSVSVGDVRRGRFEWCRNVYDLAIGLCWRAGGRLLLGNLDTAKLGP